ncbi:MAG: SDR family NAD(P)-dependent oxidoreductase [Albidovulum sp.]|nr:SDR family NAD(P)-dependent oxidoreductase [Albidovulum sp.]
MNNVNLPGKGKSILVTGCSSGIGYDAAFGLRKRGWRVFATCRKEADCQRLIKSGLESFRLDYADEASIADGFGEAIERTGGTLDALFNNGAYAMPGAVEDLPRDALRDIFETNLFGYHDLTRRAIPVMRSQGYGRIVNNSSVLGFCALRMRGAYASTKHALNGLTDTLRLELSRTDIKVILIEPGPVTSKIRENSRQHFERWIDCENSVWADFYRRSLKPRLYDPKQARDKFELPASAVTAKLVSALESRSPKPHYYVTTPTFIIGFLKRALPIRAQDKFLLKI